jgi:outer membrane protein OmpA-like peptidoglycan-associated protein
MKKVLVLSALLMSFVAFGQSSIANKADQPMNSASVDQLIEKLAPEPAVRTRGLRNLAPTPKSVDLVIQFDFDSAQLQPASKPLLDNLASAMKSDKLMQVNFKVEGHTDAKGTEVYNQQLSQKRAEAVVSYMVERGIDRSRMESVGKGFSELLYPDKPQAMENRRVRIMTVQ